MELNPYWHGTHDELRRLIGAVERNCACLPASETCGSHAMLKDEHVLNHLVYAVRIRGRLTLEEWSTQDELAFPGGLADAWSGVRPSFE
jgi:hypothetical protein